MTEKREDVEKTIISMLKEDYEATEVAKIAIVQALTANDEFSDLSEEQVLYLAILSTLAQHFKSPFLQRFAALYIRYRKSKGRNDRRELVKAFESLQRDDEGLRTKVSSLLGLSQ